jgi:hypothetical protein
MAIRFPQFDARDLDGRNVDVPAGLTGRINLLVVAFLREQQEDVESWVSALAKLESENSGLESWVAPILPRGYRLFRGAIDGGMRAGIPEPRLRRHTITAYMDVGRLQRDLGLSGSGEINLYLLDAQGVVRAHESGAFAEEKLERIAAAIGELDAPLEGKPRLDR